MTINGRDSARSAIARDLPGHRTLPRDHRADVRRVATARFRILFGLTR